MDTKSLLAFIGGIAAVIVAMWISTSTITGSMQQHAATINGRIDSFDACLATMDKRDHATAESLGELKSLKNEIASITKAVDTLRNRDWQITRSLASIERAIGADPVLSGKATR